MHFETKGLVGGPVLICIPGLMGGPEDFSQMVPEIGEKFTMLIIDPNDKQRMNGGINLTAEAMEQISYDSTAEDVKDYILQNFPDQDYYFLGMSLGGKVVFDFAAKFPELFHGGVVTDVGPGSFSESVLFKVVENIVDNIDLNVPWPDLKKTLQEVVPDKSLRVLIQTQIFYPNKIPPAIWKTGMSSFEKLLNRQALENQEEDYFKVDGLLAKLGRYIYVLHSEHLSGISERTHKDMESMQSIRLFEVPHASHFLHVTHKDLIIENVLKCLSDRLIVAGEEIKVVEGQILEAMTHERNDNTLR